MKHQYVYRFFDKDESIIYVGQTIQEIDKRLTRHFSVNSHLPKYMRSDTCRIEYAVCKTRADVNIYEAYYIALYHPRMNAVLVVPDKPSMTLPELEWWEYDNYCVKRMVEDDRQRIEKEREAHQRELDEKREARRQRHIERKSHAPEGAAPEKEKV